MAGPKTGLLDLEKELTCSICTDLLYQPLTLLDCLHTFCGSCLKEWFTSQASRAHPVHTSNPYTCPSCRSSVRETRPDAKVTTLLDMFVQANPGSAKTNEEKEETAQRYKPGEDVMPRLHQAVETEDSDEEADRRMIEEVREMSLRDVGGRGPRSYERGVRHRHRSPDPREDEMRQRRRRTEDRLDRGEGRRPARSRGNDPAHSESRSQARQIEHQSSLRSLLSTSEVDSSEMEEEILRQIIDEGLLDGIDLNNIDVSQEDALSERIAEAYRRRHLHRSRSQDARNEDTRGSSASISPSAREHSRRRHRTRSSSGTDHTSHSTTNSSHPPISRPHLLEAYPVHQGHRHRNSSENRRQTSPGAASSATQRQAARSAADLSDRSRTTEGRHRRPSDLISRGRTSTDPHPRPLNQTTQDSEHGEISRRHDSPLVSVEGTVPENTSFASLTSGYVSENLASRPSSSGTDLGRSTHQPSSVSAPEPELYLEPSITCERCGKQSIEYDLHANCSICKNGNYNLCRRCYRASSGCLHWYGFGHSAMQRFHNTVTARQDLPHVMIERKYSQPKSESIMQAEDNGRRMTVEDPSLRLQSGAFCSICSAFANDAYWKCESCNDGEWGFCNTCVNTGKCCTHRLLPIAHRSTFKENKDLERRGKQHAVTSFAPIAQPRMPELFPAPNSALSGQYRPLDFATNCNICKYPIQPSQTRFHCYECNKGDYDICTMSYLMLVANGHISRENGDKGWRRCPKGHRMVVIGFEDSSVGQWRVIVKDLVGGHALKDKVREATISSQEPSWRTRTVSYRGSGVDEGSNTSIVPLLFKKFPPDGGAGMRVLANWSYWPQDDATDELGFPRGAEIREAEDMNGDWFWGSYAGVKGLFPGPYVKILSS